MGVDQVGAWMGFAIGDYDGDADLDIIGKVRPYSVESEGDTHAEQLRPVLLPRERVRVADDYPLGRNAHSEQDAGLLDPNRAAGRVRIQGDPRLHLCKRACT